MLVYADSSVSCVESPTIQQVATLTSVCLSRSTVLPVFLAIEAAHTFSSLNKHDPTEWENA